MEEKALQAKVEVVDGVIKVSAELDVVEALKELAKKSDNSIDDGLVAIVEAAKANLDWKGVAAGLL